ncbi:MAG TPA: hypothetical protein V6D48_04040 [Oculatellaceae cyanobacterium]
MNHNSRQLETKDTFKSGRVGEWESGRVREIHPLTFSLLSLFLSVCGVIAVPSFTRAQATTHLVVVVNSNQDGGIQPDEALTLREAIEIVNGRLSVDRLSNAEKALVKPTSPDQPSRIEFNLPGEQTTIRLKEILPPLSSPGVVVDGTTQPGYDATRSPTAEIAIPTPVVVITPAPEIEILRGLTIVGDRITIRGLSLHGFGERPQVPTLNIPPADIFIANQRWELGTGEERGGEGELGVPSGDKGARGNSGSPLGIRGQGGEDCSIFSLSFSRLEDLMLFKNVR